MAAEEALVDLEYDSVSGAYKAPIQMQANNGILVVDDFGRQQLLPTELLNRWIVPLARGIDFLRLVNGSKFTVPFELKLVASTNLDPHELGDEVRRVDESLFGRLPDGRLHMVDDLSRDDELRDQENRGAQREEVDFD